MIASFSFGRKLVFAASASQNVATQRFSSHFVYKPDDNAPIAGPTTRLNMFQSINSALDTALSRDESALIFGEDVAFGGVFRCTLNLQVRETGSIDEGYTFHKLSITEEVWTHQSVQYAVVRARHCWIWYWSGKHWNNGNR